MKLLKAFRLFWFENGHLRCSLSPTLFGGGGGPSQTTSTVTQSSIPDWLQPQTNAMLGAATQQIFNTTPAYDEWGNPTGTSDITGIKGFTPYSTNPSNYIAGFSPMQQQSFQGAANLQTPSQFNAASDITSSAAMGGLGSAGQAYNYGAQGAGYGAQGAGFGLGSAQQAQGLANLYGGQGVGYGAQAAGLAGQGLGYQGIGTNAGNIALGYGNQGLGYGAQGAGYGGQGAGYGAQAANLAGAAQGYGAQGAGYGAQGVNIGQQATGLTGQTLGYGQTAANIGQGAAAGAQGLGSNVAGQALGYGAQAAQQGDIYGQMATSPGSMQAYMSPYQQNVTDVAKQAALRDFNVAQTMRQANAAKSGAYGGARQAIENAEAQRNLNTQLQGIESTGLQNAFQNAQQAQQFQAQQRLAGLQGAQQGLNTALGGGQLGLSGAGQAIQGQQAALQGVGQAANLYGVGLQGTAQGMQGAQAGLSGLQQAGNLYGQGMQGAQVGLQGTAQGLQATQAAQQGVQNYLAGQQLGVSGLNAANQAYQTGIQGAGLGLTGVGQYTNAGQLGLAGTAQGMQGAGYGLQGVTGAQAGYGQAAQAGTALSNIGQQQQAANLGILNLQNQYGGQQTQQQQDIINQAIQNYANAQQYPMQQLGMYNALLRGYTTPTSASTQYQSAPSMISQLGGLGATALGAYGALKAEGGVIDKPKTYKSGGLVDLVVADALAEASK